jgi:hypothetical protein
MLAALRLPAGLRLPAALLRLAAALLRLVDAGH